MEISVKQAMTDLTNTFLGKIHGFNKKHWNPEEIEAEFLKSIYFLSLEYIDELGKEKK